MHGCLVERAVNFNRKRRPCLAEVPQGEGEGERDALLQLRRVNRAALLLANGRVHPLAGALAEVNRVQRGVGPPNRHMYTSSEAKRRNSAMVENPSDL